MTRTEVYREVLRLDRELKAARTKMREAQMRARVTGMKLSAAEYAAAWDHIHQLERTVETTRLRLAEAEETAAERFVGIVRIEHPEIFTIVASRAGIELC
jgi:hypothetical protein